jgi:hypothetical protein
VAGAVLAAVALVGIPQAAEAATAGTVYSADGGAKLTGTITWNNAWWYSASWTSQDLKADGRTPYVTVTAYTWNTTGGGTTVKKSQTFSSAYGLYSFGTFYNSAGAARLATVQVKVCNGGSNTYCKYVLYDNPYS